MVFLFWAALLLIVYTYFGYPLIIAFFRRVKMLNVRKCPIHPSVSVVIAAHNEERNIERRLRNLLTQEYPHERLEIIVVSDGSTDRTVELVRAFASERVNVYALEENRGKAVALNHGVAQAKGEIIVFTDVRQEFKVDAIKNLVANFADASVGCVSGELYFWDDPASHIEAEMGAYWRYEKFIRRSESSSGSVVGATGCIYAIRRELYQPLPAGTILDDVLTPMNIARQGKRVLFDAQSVACDIISKDANQEWRRKVRTLAGNWQLFSLSPWLLIPGCNPLWWRFMSHKLLRVLVPFEMVILLVTGFMLSGSAYRVLTLLQLILYGVALLGVLVPTSRRIRLVNLSYFFMILNAAAVAGFWKWATGGCATAWQPAYPGKEQSCG